MMSLLGDVRLGYTLNVQHDGTGFLIVLWGRPTRPPNGADAVMITRKEVGNALMRAYPKVTNAEVDRYYAQSMKC